MPDQGWTVVDDKELAELKADAERYHEIREIVMRGMPTLKSLEEDAENWRRLMELFDTSCDKCFLGHVCGTHRKAEAVCEDIKDALSEGKEEK